MKKLLTIAAALFVLGFLTGCKEGGSAQEQPQQKTDEPAAGGDQGTAAEQPATEGAAEGAAEGEGATEGQ